jgi:hypothetical protein
MRRWRRIIGGITFLFGVLILMTWIAAPTIATWWIGPRLPWTKSFKDGSVSLTAVTTNLQIGERSDVQVMVTPARARSIATEATGTWMPPWVVRTGQQVVGSVQLPILRPQPFVWEVIAGGLSPAPMAGVFINHVELSEFLLKYGQTYIMYGGQPIMSVTYVVTAGRITDVTTTDDPPLTKRLWVEARGSIILKAGTVQRAVTVRRLAGHATTTFTPHADGYRMTIQVKIEESDADEIIVPVLGDVRPMLLKQLETAANDGLIDGLEPVWLPAWMPLDTRVDVVIE